jgi:3-methyladenine DNA glycosylase/8-oxoguanine DNA glycosylase
MAKATYVKGLAQRAVDGLVPSLEQCTCLTDDDLVQKLTTIKGIGRWTVQMLLIFNLGRPDVLPTEDLGVRRGYQIVYNKRDLPEPAHLHRMGSRWEPFRTTASLYLWRAADFVKNDEW